MFYIKLRKKLNIRFLHLQLTVRLRLPSVPRELLLRPAPSAAPAGPLGPLRPGGGPPGAPAGLQRPRQVAPVRPAAPDLVLQRQAGQPVPGARELLPGAVGRPGGVGRILRAADGGGGGEGGGGRYGFLQLGP